MWFLDEPANEGHARIGALSAASVKRAIGAGPILLMRTNHSPNAHRSDAVRAVGR